MEHGHGTRQGRHGNHNGDERRREPENLAVVQQQERVEREVLVAVYDATKSLVDLRGHGNLALTDSRAFVLVAVGHAELAVG